jgi:cation diffusion facilitator CzcD-associated flavoprotein CzcO
MDYLQSYADDNLVTPHIYYNQKITHIGYNKKQFVLTSGKEKNAYDNLSLSFGIFSEPNKETFKDENKFQGLILHDQFCNNISDLSGYGEIVIKGRGISAFEKAAYFARNGIKVHHVFSRSAFIIPRMLDYNSKKIPFDLLFYRYKDSIYKDYKTLSAEQKYKNTNAFLFGKLGDQGLIDPDLYIDPDSEFPESTVVCDDYLDLKKSGMIVPYKDRIAYFETDGVTLESGKKIKTKFVCVAGGYKITPPAMDKTISKALGLEVDNKSQPLTTYKSTFVQGLPGLSCTGLYRAPSMTVVELNARLVAAVNSGQIKRPSEKRIKVETRKEIELRHLYPKPNFPKGGNPVDFALDLAHDLGVKPQKYYKVGEPVISAHFRENGIGAKPEIAEQQNQELIKRLKQ